MILASQEGPIERHIIHCIAKRVNDELNLGIAFGEILDQPYSSDIYYALCRHPSLGFAVHRACYDGSKWDEYEITKDGLGVVIERISEEVGMDKRAIIKRIADEVCSNKACSGA